MPQEKKAVSRYELVAGDFLKLLTDDVFYDDWANGLAREKCFYIRGITWFRREVLGADLSLADCKNYIPQMKAMLKDRTSWHGRSFSWLDAYSPRQFIDAASQRKRATAVFQKAV